MSYFNDMLNDSESLFTNNVEALDFDYLPKLIPFREQEQKAVAAAIKPIFQRRNGRNMLIHGKPGVGKTVAVKHLLKELEEETDEIFPVFINCWQKNTSYKVILEICDQLGYKFTQNKKTEELFKVAEQIINKNEGAVFVFDEVDKAEDVDFIYSLIELVYRKSIIVITNYPEWIQSLDERIKSRFLPDLLEFKPYSEKETVEILRQRMKYAFVPGIFEEQAFLKLARKASEIQDIRTGLFLLKEAVQYAEDHAKKKVEMSDADHAISKLDGYSMKSSGELVDTEKSVLDCIEKNSSKKIGDVHKAYLRLGHDMSYKTFQRRVKKLEDGGFISVKKTEGGTEGNTSIISFGGTKKLTDF